MKQDQPGWGQYFSASALGIEVGVALAVGMGIGWGLEQALPHSAVAAGDLHRFRDPRDSAT